MSQNNREIKLTDYLQSHSQQEAGRRIGLSQKAISKICVEGRDIRLLVNDSDEIVYAYETGKPIGKFRYSAA